MNKHINEYTLEELQAIDNYNEKALFDSIILVPMEELHDSGYRCMKGILVNRGVIVGSVSGWSDVVHPNGIGNFGRYGPEFEKYLRTRTVPYMDLSMDCLEKSRCIRLMMSGKWEMDDFIGSDMDFYKTMREENETN